MRGRCRRRRQRGSPRVGAPAPLVAKESSPEPYARAPLCPAGHLPLKRGDRLLRGPSPIATV
ncbi:MAG: hypothetical protein EOQ64_04450 [Mesorhizobium sp.]|nr:MAG: hypothetical protein EOQ64_04450 [Mesorhizobium sp.]